MRRRVSKTHYKGNRVSLPGLKEGVGTVGRRIAVANSVDELDGRTAPADRQSQ
jgi:hypothetical protein